MSQRNYDKQPTKYGGARHNRRSPITGRPMLRYATQQAAPTSAARRSTAISLAFHHSARAWSQAASRFAIELNCSTTAVRLWKDNEMAASISLPKIGVKPWFSLRSKVASTPSTKLTPSFVAAHFQMAGEKSALDNIVRPLRALGLVEEDGSLTERGNRWRIDASYTEACEEILKDVYPSELAAFTNESGGVDTGTVATWLMQRGQGDANAKAMAATYAMIAARSLELERSATSTNGQPKKSGRSGRSMKESKLASATTNHEQPAPTVGTGLASNRTPTIHLDIQVHIPPAASAEQIDQIFASMAKHLYRQ